MLELSDIAINNASDIEQKIYTKCSLIAISHGLEDMVAEFKLKSEIFVTFQKFRFFLAEIERYKILDNLCKKMYIFARNINKDMVKGFKNTVFIEINENDPLVDEWDIIINHPEHPAVFLSKEVIYSEPVKEDQFRKFKGFLSFSQDILAETLKVMKSKLIEYGINYDLVNTQFKKSGQDIESRKMSFFLNRTLSEIEDKSAQLVAQNTLLENTLIENVELSNEIIKRLCYSAEYKDEDSALHMIRVSLYSSILYGMVETCEEKRRLMNYAALMHDIGKIGIADSILLKPGKLTMEEFDIMKTHTINGARILSNSKRGVIKMGYEIALNHHEKWDGSGYPSGISGKNIPLTARVVAIVDVFDALSTKRVYKSAFPIETCIEILKEQRNKHFDGEILDLFLNSIDEILRYRDMINLRFNEPINEDIFTSFFNNSMNFITEE
ncbi:HD domain-containing protein [Clostridium bowmanii]|uniref:HD domain-containing phosphohydrolase n=1 Tax=Clostridium bowmanii TaxID=132925 RepID=UPI001C0C2440|nr:HD domain-containing phosphohydrolase [Clostridium bowmanii]MBU3190782.1 HD domain-containing protein [Clostridium bowmanii]MCA1075314.1 HD domain-containing protein [Clostridium bowmanii]